MVIFSCLLIMKYIASGNNNIIIINLYVNFMHLDPSVFLLKKDDESFTSACLKDWDEFYKDSKEVYSLTFVLVSPVA